MVVGLDAIEFALPIVASGAAVVAAWLKSTRSKHDVKATIHLSGGGVVTIDGSSPDQVKKLIESINADPLLKDKQPPSASVSH
jgi:hypothetical protein